MPMTDFLTGLTQGATTGLTRAYDRRMKRRDEEKELAQEMRKMFYKAQIEKELEDPMERRKKEADLALAEGQAAYFDRTFGGGQPAAQGQLSGQPTMQGMAQPQTGSQSQPTVRDIWGGIPEEERKYYNEPEPIYRTFKGMDYIAGYKNPERTPEGEMYFKGKDQEQAAKAKTAGKQMEAGAKATTGFARQAGSFKDYAKYYAGALDEGGAGNILKRWQAQRRIGTGFGQEGLSSTAKLYGQGLEMALGAMPLLTGSSRIIEGIFSKLSLTYPQGNENAEIAAAKLDQSLRNQFILAKVMDRMGFDINDDSEMKELANSPEELQQVEEAMQQVFVTNPKNKSLISTYRLTPEEENEYDDIRQDVLSPLLKKAGKKKTSVADVAGRAGQSGGRTKSGLSYTIER